MAPNFGTKVEESQQYNCSLNSTIGIKPRIKSAKTIEEECPLIIAFFTFLSYGVLLVVGYVKEFFYSPTIDEQNREDYVPIFVGFESFFTRNVYRRVRECWNRPICSVPGAEIDLMEQHSPDYGWTVKLTGTIRKCINAGSYNYLGFAENDGPCHKAAAKSLKELGLTTSSPILELGFLRLIKDLDCLVAKFLKVDAAITFGMGFATNVLCLPALFGPGCLVLSDEFNHASLILGLKISGATVKVFRHDDYNHLETLLRYYIIYGHPRTRRAWRKIIIVVEGIYSMEGTICNLPLLIELKKKYKAYLYVDEAHSIGALGSGGGGVVNYFDCNPKDVDILMGTFTKSFGAAGGYIAGSKTVIDYLRVNSDAQSYAAAMAPPVAQQIFSSMLIIMGLDGTKQGHKRIELLARNVRYFRQRLIQLGFIVYGDDASPVVPLILYNIPKIAVVVKELTKRGIAGVGVGFPATNITGSRLRFCLSAAHTKEMLDKILNAINEIGDIVCCKHSATVGRFENIKW